ncbi:NADH-quinone oxidoreductase subunit M [Aurantimonas sp. 22II-16-19i]|uniref:complex I subunit 4 family protein n=1 Tax=Aurantimonas sp. 22II-16-19i TaxID=1317114 RepID=UPI0009F7D2DC|nr:NADH-quinone oxidoreductase subunit M [Aurantimonas sp. 22II-16-19i]ORE97588.1 proton-translocating NADH-quinone oxidoreductase subunit M [Aurantimonas sp. 22II-16-19i]
MLTLSILIPLLAALGLFVWPDAGNREARLVALGASALSFLCLVIVWIGFDSGPGAADFQSVAEIGWIDALGVAWRVGVDGMSLAVSLMSGLLFICAIAWPADTKGRARQYYGWFLFLQGVSLGLFLTLDLLVFYVFFDLTLVGMYFLIGRWGHGEAEYAALKFFVYTLAGSLAILLAILGLVLANGTLTFDMRALIAAQPLGGTDLRSSLILLGFLVGFAIKTPLVPFHTWLPLAHVEAPGPASAVLAGVLLKMGTYGMVRIPFQMMRETFAAYAFPLALVALVAILWGSLVALGQTNLKRRIAYTSVNHMGYTVLGIAAAGAMVGPDAVRRLALSGAVTEMVAHGLITGALFLIAGSFYTRTGTYELSRYGGLARVTPLLMVVYFLAAFASFGLPGLAGFVAEFQIFAGSFGVYPVVAAIALVGLVVTAALFLSMGQQIFFGETAPQIAAIKDLKPAEIWPLVALLALVVLIGLLPGWLIDMIQTGSAFAPFQASGGPQ